MTLQMFIQDILISKAEVDFQLCETLEQREDRVTDLKVFMANKHFSKAFVSCQEPVFYLIAQSDANFIIREDALENHLLPELENELKNKKATVRGN